MRKPKPPAPRNVSATLRTAGFRAIGDGSEGYEATWWPGPAGPGVHVAFYDYTEDRTARAAPGKAAGTEAAARTAMAATLRHKGWQVEERGTFLVVREASDA